MMCYVIWYEEFSKVEKFTCYILKLERLRVVYSILDIIELRQRYAMLRRIKTCNGVQRIVVISQN